MSDAEHGCACVHACVRVSQCCAVARRCADAPFTSAQSRKSHIAHVFSPRIPPSCVTTTHTCPRLPCCLPQSRTTSWQELQLCVSRPLSRCNERSSRMKCSVGCTCHMALFLFVRNATRGCVCACDAVPHSLSLISSRACSHAVRVLHRNRSTTHWPNIEQL
jgi:hypothetical protein